MTVNKNKLKYIPGTYAKKRTDAAQMADQYFREWETKRRKMKEKESAAVDIPPAICISRKIGVGALEIADILEIEENEAKSLLGRFDKEQRDFFKKAFGKKDASPYEFDLVVNCDYLTEPQGAAEVVAQAYTEKFESLILA
jgi:hypothetical protein